MVMQVNALKVYHGVVENGSQEALGFAFKDVVMDATSDQVWGDQNVVVSICTYRGFSV